MTIKEAEAQYIADKESLDKKSEIKRKVILIAGIIIGFAFIVTGAVLLIVASNIPPTILSGISFDNNTVEVLFGSISLVFGCTALVIAFLFPFVVMRKGSRVYPDAVKNLYMNYIRCTDMDERDRDFYKQKLEDIRNESLRNSMKDVSAVILFGILHK